MTDEALLQLPGADKLLALYGRWPSFHDAEIVSLYLNRSSGSSLVIHTFALTSGVDEAGRYITEKHALVSFHLGEVLDCELYGFNMQNVTSGVEIDAVEGGYKLVLGGCFGLEGFVTAVTLRIELERGIPPNSLYARYAASEGATA